MDEDVLTRVATSENDTGDLDFKAGSIRMRHTTLGRSAP